MDSVQQQQAQHSVLYLYRKQLFSIASLFRKPSPNKLIFQFFETLLPPFFSPFTTCFLTEKLRYFKKIDATVRYCRPKNKCCSTFRGVLCDAVSSCAASASQHTELMLKRWRNVLCILLPFPLSYRSAASTFPLDISPTTQVFFFRILSSCVTYCRLTKVRIATPAYSNQGSLSFN